MAWSYSGDPSSSDRDAVRFEIQDTDQATPLVSDEEIAYALAEEGSVAGAAARCCEALARRFGSMVDVSITSAGDSVKRSYSSMARTYTDLARSLRGRCAGGAPWHGGGSKARKEALARDNDRVQPAFSRGQFDAPGAAPMSAVTPAEIAAARATLDGLLLDSCTITRKQTAADDAGGARSDWPPIASDVPCRLHPASSAAGGGTGVGQSGGRLNDDTTHLVTLTAKTDVAIEDRITVDGAVYEVLQVQSGGALELQRHAEVKAAP